MRSLKHRDLTARLKRKLRFERLKKCDWKGASEAFVHKIWKDMENPL